MPSPKKEISTIKYSKTMTRQSFQRNYRYGAGSGMGGGGSGGDGAPGE